MSIRVRGMSIDERDIEIVSMMIEDGRRPIAEIAKKLGVSDVTVLKRLRKLERAGVIKRYTAVVDPKKLGYEYVAIVGFDVEPDKILYVANKLKEAPSTKYVAVTTGDHVVIATVWARDDGDFKSVMEEFSKLPGVKKICPAIVLDVVKE